MKDHRLKYVEMTEVFQQKALDLEISARQQNRACEQFAVRIASMKPKTGEEFERVEMMKHFVIKTSEMNDNVLGLLDYFKKLLQEITWDYEVLEPGSKLRDSLRDAQHTIEAMIETRDKTFYEEYKRRKDQINSQQS